MDKTRIPNNEPENHLTKFLSDAKQIMDVTENFTSELSDLQNNLQQHESMYGKLQNQLDALNETHNEGLLTLEINAGNKSFINEFYNNYLNLAQTIYSSYSELHREVHFLKNNWDHIQEVRNEIEEKVSHKKDVLNTKEKELHEKIQEIKNMKIEMENEQTEDEEEHQKIHMELKKLNNEIYRVRSNINLKELCLLEEHTALSNKSDEIRKILEITAVLDEQMLKTSELFDKMNNENPTETISSINDIHEQIIQTEIENRRQESLLQELQDLNISTQNEITSTQHNIQINEIKKENISQELIKIHAQIIEMEQNTAEQVKCCDIAAEEAQQKLLKRKEYKEQLLKDMSLLQEHHNQECAELKTCILNIPDDNIDYLNKIETVQAEYNNIQKAIQVKEKLYQDSLHDIEEKIEQAKLKSLEYTFDFQKQKQYVAEIEPLLTQFQLEYKAAKDEIEKNKKTAGNLREEIAKLKVRMVENKKRQERKEFATKRLRNWDSDSSMEDWIATKK